MMMSPISESMKMSDLLAPGQIEQTIEIVTRHGSGWILLFVFLSVVVENFFPPYPSDVVMFAAGFVSGSGRLGLPWLLLVSVSGSLLSTMLVHSVGRKYGRAIFERRRLRFLHPDRLPRIEEWFKKYGDSVLLASRFLPGVRSLIALTAGIGGVTTMRMLLLSLISIVLWNSIIILSAFFLWNEWESVYQVIESYSKVVIIAIMALVLAFIAYRTIRRKRAE
jgi:membrane protein DedA with SNARE-associated domain